jgi:3-isopropylmalate dehydrogenase
MSYRVALVEGDGIGPEVTVATKEVLEEVSNVSSVSLNFVQVEAGDHALEVHGEALPETSLEEIEKSDCCLKAPIGKSAYDVIVHLRQRLDLYANIRPAKAFPSVSCLNSKTDLVIVRENTEDLYVGLETADDDRATATRVITRKACERIAQFAFQLARERRNSVTAVHKANVMKKTDGLFLKVCNEVASKYPNVHFSNMLVDAAAMNLIRNPQDFDVIVTTNVYGDILSDESAQVVGGLGLAASANVGQDFAIFEPVHGCAPDIAGKWIANPTSLVLSAAMMLDWLGQRKRHNDAKLASRAIQRAVECCLAARQVTPDLGGKLSTMEMARAIKKQLSQVIVR